MLIDPSSDQDDPAPLGAKYAASVRDIEKEKALGTLNISFLRNSSSKEPLASASGFRLNLLRLADYKSERLTMSKKIRFALAALLASIALFAGLSQPSANSSSSAQPLRLCGECFSPAAAQQNPTTATAARNAALIAATRDVLKETSEIRQLTILRPVQSSTQSRAEIERALIKSLDEDTTPAEMHADEITLKKLGLAPADFQYRVLMLRVLTEQVAGYYDPKTGQFHLADWIDLDGQKPIMAHELTHALQDQHFNLRRFEHWPKGDSDAELAAHALIEGDATLAMALYVANNPLRALAFLKSLSMTGMSSAELDKAPRALRETLVFPYQDGEKWVSALYKQGGWSGVSQAFATLPQSTEQILHPEKYFAHEAPVKVTLPDVTSLLNASRASAVSGQWAVGGGQSLRVKAHHSSLTRAEFSSDCFLTAHCSLLTAHSLLPTAHCPPFANSSSLLTGGWRRLAYDVQGEWGFYLILDQFLKSPAESGRAAAGWAGDRFAVYEGPRGEACFISLSVWDTENDAREFFDAYVKRTELRHPNAARSPTPDLAAPNSELRTTSRLAWQTSEGLVTVELRGNHVLVVEGYSDRVDREALQRALWK